MKLKKIAGLLLIAFVVFYILSFPEDSSTILKSTFSALGDAATNFSSFVRSVFA